REAQCSELALQRARHGMARHFLQHDVALSTDIAQDDRGEAHTRPLPRTQAVHEGAAEPRRAVADLRQAVALPRTGVEEDVEATVRRRTWRTLEIEQIPIWRGGTRLARRHCLRAEHHGHDHGESQELDE